MLRPPFRPLSPLLGLSLAWACANAYSAPPEPTPWPGGQLAPSGYTGAINAPTADVLPWGGASAALSNSNPEIGRRIHSGSFGSLNAGLGLLPGLELVGRLAYEGDINCSIYDRPACQAGQRDLSLGAKYQLPLELPWGTRLALGMSDYGGAATNYRQVYAVATSTWGPLDVSVGYGRPRAAQALLDGAFGSAYLRISQQLAAALEHDSREWRSGVQWRQPLGTSAALQVGVSRKLSDATAQQRWQLNAALNLTLGQPAAPMPSALMRRPVAQESWIRPAPTPLAANTPTPDAATPRSADASPHTAAALPSIQAHEPPPNSGASSSSPGPSAATLLQQLERNGFALVQIRHWPAQGSHHALWQVQVEPRKWRQSQLDAVAAAVHTWLQHLGPGAHADLALTLTYQQVPTLEVQTSATCLQAWLAGIGTCGTTDGQQLSSPQLARPGQLVPLAPAGDSRNMEQFQSDDLWRAAAPQFTLGPSLRTTVGTELGLLDYSLAAELGSEVHLARGLFWQGTFELPLAHSDDFGTGHAFDSQRHRRASFNTALLSYWRPLPWGLAAQLNAGALDRNHIGGQLDALWLDTSGRWRLSGSVGRYRYKPLQVNRTPALAELRYSLLPGVWDVQATAGRFLGNDKGVRLSSNHWFGSTQVQLFMQSTRGNPMGWGEERLHVLGFSINLPLGPQQALGDKVTLRGTDRWGWGLQTKVRGTDNALPVGYGDMPHIRHGLGSDATDHDRNGHASLKTRLPQLRSKIIALGAPH